MLCDLFKSLILFATRFGQLQDCLQKMVSLLPRAEGIMRTKVCCFVFCTVLVASLAILDD